jgi:hypothetical protein
MFKNGEGHFLLLLEVFIELILGPILAVSFILRKDFLSEGIARIIVNGTNYLLGSKVFNGFLKAPKKGKEDEVLVFNLSPSCITPTNHVISIDDKKITGHTLLLLSDKSSLSRGLFSLSQMFCVNEGSITGLTEVGEVSTLVRAF